jgi:hypothetical protein
MIDPAGSHGSSLARPPNCHAFLMAQFVLEGSIKVGSQRSSNLQVQIFEEASSLKQNSSTGNSKCV